MRKIGLLVLIACIALLNGVQVERYVYVGDADLNVSLRISNVKDVSALIVYENITERCSLLRAIPSPDKSNGSVHAWILKDEAISRGINYSVVCGSESFNATGVWKTIEEEGEISQGPVISIKSSAGNKGASSQSQANQKKEIPCLPFTFVVFALCCAYVRQTRILRDGQ